MLHAHTSTLPGVSSRGLLSAATAGLLLCGLLGGVAQAATPGAPAQALSAELLPDTPTLGPASLTLSSSATVVTSTFTLTAPTSRTFTQIQMAVRPAANPGSTDGRLDFGTLRNVTFSGTRTFTMSTAGLAPGAYVARPAYLVDGRWVDGATRSFRILAAAPSAPVLGSATTTVSANGSAVTASFTLSSSTNRTFSQVQMAVRPAATPRSTDGSLDFGTVRDATISGTRTFTMSTSTLPPGSYVARPAYLLNGVWHDGATVSFAIIKAPPVSNQTLGAVSGFSPGGGFPFLSDAALARDLDGIKTTGAAWVRVDFPWSAMEPARGSYSWANLDRVTNAAAARGIKVLALPAYSPAWARPGCGTDKCPPNNPADYARFVAAAATHFGPDRVQAWELWNEPNIPSFWSPRPNVDAYATLLTQAAAALKTARPGAFVLSAGLSPAYTDGTNIAPADFVRRLYTLGAMRNIDAVAIHPYSDKSLPLTPGTLSWNTFLQMSTVHDIMAAHGDGTKQVWGTEFGVSTGTSAKSTSEAQQAAIIEQGYARLADGTWPWFGTLFAYSLRDHANNISDWQSNYGLLRNNSTPKPAYNTFVNMMRQPYRR